MKNIIKGISILAIILLLVLSVSCEIEVTGNDVVPTCEITYPEDGAVIEDSVLTVIAEASDPNGYIKEVVFYIDGDSVAIDNKEPYECNIDLNSNFNGLTEIKVVAKDNGTGEKEYIILVLKLKIIPIPSGNFNMGTNNNHNVNISNNFYMGKHEVTNEEYCYMLNYALAQGLLKVVTAYYDENTYLSVINKNWDSQTLLYLDDQVYDSDYKIYYNGSKFAINNQKRKRPVTQVTWFGAAFYCNMLSRQAGLNELYNIYDWSCSVYPTSLSGYRLPTEAEWEYTASYNDERIYPWGNDSPTSNHANYGLNIGHTTDIGSYSPTGDNVLGLCDMAGNASEWCNDWYDKDYYDSSPNSNPTGPVFGRQRILRGGNWKTSCQVTARSRRYPSDSVYGYTGIGFRIVKFNSLN